MPELTRKELLAKRKLLETYMNELGKQIKCFACNSTFKNQEDAQSHWDLFHR
jgi:hypothetical protein